MEDPNPTPQATGPIPRAVPDYAPHNVRDAPTTTDTVEATTPARTLEGASRLTLEKMAAMTPLRYSLGDSRNLWSFPAGGGAGKLSPWAESAILKLHHCQLFNLTGLPPAALSILLCDRLSSDPHAQTMLPVMREVRLTIKGEGGEITGCADWVLGHLHPYPSENQVLVIVETKAPSCVRFDLPRLFCYLLAVSQAQEAKSGIRRPVSGIVTDSVEYIFAHLTETLTCRATVVYNWHQQSVEIVKGLDCLLKRAQGSPVAATAADLSRADKAGNSPHEGNR